MADIPIKRIIIAGCRDYNNYTEAKKYIDECISDIKKDNTIIILSGGSNGADKIGERYAKENDFQIELFLADWKRFGKSAGPKRNKLMAEATDYVICFWDGKSRGTKSMIEYAQMYDKPLKIKYILGNNFIYE